MSVNDLVFGFLGLVIAVSMIGAAGYDIAAYRNGMQTISALLLASARQNPVGPALFGLFLGLVAGILIGHVYWPQK